MSRRPRIHLDGVPLHIVRRGLNREPCFLVEEDCHAYLRWLAMFTFRVHSFLADVSLAAYGD